MSLYLDHFGLRVPPFSTSPDPEFAYQTREHQLAVTKVAYSVEEQRGLFLLTGPIGSGKTTVAELLVSTWEEQPDRYAVAHLTDPSATTPAAFLRVVLGSFGQPVIRNLQDLKDALRLFLVECYQNQQIAVLLLDEAQTISRANLDLLQMLSNEATAKAKLIQIVLFAQDNFQNKLSQKPALRSRITGGAHLDPLTLDDALEMLRFRASVAGGKFDEMFLPEAHKPLYNAAGGIPRELCVLCDAALVNAFALRRPAVDMECLAAAADDLRFKGFRLQSAD
jgi:type II secretory pathway predicted ATPase ExeA